MPAHDCRMAALLTVARNRQPGIAMDQIRNRRPLRKA
jgi:hypothetical protein